MKNESNLLKIIPVMFAFFAMGFVDLVGIATNNIKADFGLNDTTTNLLTSMVFFWFFILSVPTGLLMNKIGRRKTVILSLFVTFLAMIVPFIDYNLPLILVSFALLGIGNTLMQVSLNPLVTNIISGERLASALTLGQFFKAIASALAPMIAGWAALKFGSWKMLYPIFAVASLIPLLWLSFTPIKEVAIEKSTSTIGKCIALLGNKMILLLFIGILMHVGIDVGINITSPKILMERLGMELSVAGYSITIYFIARTIGCFSGAFILSMVSAKKFFLISVFIMVIGIAGLLVFQNITLLYICIALMGLGNSNIFPIIFSQAMQIFPDRNNEVSGLMIMGIAGGAILPIFMGLASDALNSQIGALIVIALCIGYLILISSKIKK
ncbi:MAG: MFS transporter [Dysgonomonas sp.]